MRSFTRWILGHRRWIAAAWILIAVVAFGSVQQSVDALSEQVRVPGPGERRRGQRHLQRAGHGRAARQRAAHRGRAAAGGHHRSTRPARRSRSGPRCEDREQHPRRPLRRASPPRATARSSPRTAVPRSPSCGTRRATWSSPAKAATDQAEAAAEGVTVNGAQVRITGYDPLAVGDSDESSGPSVLLETMIGGLGALIVLAFVFGSLMAFVPLLMAAIAIPTTFLVLWPLAEATEVSVVVQFLISLIGLGVAIDYSLLIVMRWREESPTAASASRRSSRRWSTSARGALQRHRRRHRPAGDGRAAGALPAQHRLRRHADPADQRPRGDHAAARGARHSRAAARQDRHQPPHRERRSG